jgi:hypothetical protein
MLKRHDLLVAVVGVRDEVEQDLADLKKFKHFILYCPVKNG